MSSGVLLIVCREHHVWSCEPWFETCCRTKGRGKMIKNNPSKLYWLWEKNTLRLANHFLKMVIYVPCYHKWILILAFKRNHLRKVSANSKLRPAYDRIYSRDYEDKTVLAWTRWPLRNFNLCRTARSCEVSIGLRDITSKLINYHQTIGQAIHLVKWAWSASISKTSWEGCEP